MENNPNFRILIIDDNPAIHHDFIKILTTSNSATALNKLSQQIFGGSENFIEEPLLPNFSIDTATQGKEGVTFIQKALEKKQPYSLAFVDIRMPPGWDGIETIKHIWEIDKDIQIVICTAYSDYSWEETVHHLGKTDNLLILKKPFDTISVRQLACALTKKWQLLQKSRSFTDSLKEQVTERTKSLEKSLSIVKATLESSDEGIIVISNEGKILNFNQRFCSMWNISEEMLETGSVEELSAAMCAQLSKSDFFKCLLEDKDKNKKSEINIDEIKFNDGRIFDCYTQSQTLNGVIVGRVLNFRDITERHKLENKLEFQARHDVLTGLPNRVLLFDKI